MSQEISGSVKIFVCVCVCVRACVCVCVIISNLHVLCSAMWKSILGSKYIMMFS